MSTQPLGIRVVCDFKRSASCREYIDTGAIQTVNARVIARNEGWEMLEMFAHPSHLGVVMTLLWNNALSEDIDRGYAVKFLSFGKRDMFGMYVETITDGRLTRYYAQVNAYGIIASEEYDKVEIPDGWDD